MKKLLLPIFLLTINLFCSAQSSLLKLNTQIIISSQNPLHSNGVEQPYFTVMNDVKDDSGKILINQGTMVNMNVVRQPAKGWGKPGYMNVTPLTTTAVDGQVINLTGNFSQTGEDRTTIAWVVAGGGCLVVLGIGILAGFIVKGGEVEVPAQYMMMNVRSATDNRIQTKPKSIPDK